MAKRKPNASALPADQERAERLRAERDRLIEQGKALGDELKELLKEWDECIESKKEKDPQPPA